MEQLHTSICECKKCRESAIITRNGESAYEIAKKHGFIGTEKQWIRGVLKGPRGEDGQNGRDGKNGIDGQGGELAKEQIAKIEQTAFVQNMEIKQLRRKTRMSHVGKLKKFDFPTEFTWKNPPITILTDGHSYKTFFDASTLKNVGGRTYYIDSVNGLNTNSGLTESEPFLNINKALSVVNDNDTIIILDKILTRTSLAVTLTINKNINIIGKTKTIIIGGDTHTFTKTTGKTNVWETSRNNVARVVDYDKKYDFKQVFTLDECEVTPATWYTNGSILYMHTLESAAPNNQSHFVLINTGPFLTINGSTKNIKVYLENIEFVGGAPTIETTNSTTTFPTLIMKNMKLFYNTHTAKGAVYGAGADIYSQNVEIAYSMEDGFDYQPLNNRPTKFIEVDCIGHSNGVRDNVQGYNGSTSHTDAKGIRVGGQYYKNYGPNIADVQGTTQTLNFDVTTFDSLRDTDFSFNIQISDGKMWLFNVESFGSIADLYCPTGGTMVVDNKTVYFTKGGAGNLTIET